MPEDSPTPLQTFHLPVTEGHSLYVHTYGNPQGHPCLVVHGGPGAGSNPANVEYFDLRRHHVIMLDQRGCGQSLWPGRGGDADLAGRLTANTTAHLVEDLATLHTHLNLGPWLVYGSSWGSTLALAYAQAYPEQVSALVVSAILLGTAAEHFWFTHPLGLPRFQPQAYADLMSLLPEDTTPATLLDNAFTAMLSNTPHGLEVIRAWSHYECLAMQPESNPAELEAIFSNPAWLVPHSLLECHYLRHHWFLTEGQLLADADQLQNIPTHILQSQADMVCPPAAAHLLHAHLPHSTLTLLPTGGHRADAAMKTARREAIRSLTPEMSVKCSREA